jgi:hypothetical protein
MPKVTIGAINGPPRGLSTRWRAIFGSCRTARFGTAFARVGFGRLRRHLSADQLVGRPRRANCISLPRSSVRKRRSGSAWLIAAGGVADRRGEAFAKRLAADPQWRILHEGAFESCAQTDLRTILDRESYGQTLTGLTEDHKEAVKAFLEKREAKLKDVRARRGDQERRPMLRTRICELLGIELSIISAGMGGVACRGWRPRCRGGAWLRLRGRLGFGFSPARSATN